MVPESEQVVGTMTPVAPHAVTEQHAMIVGVP